MANHKSAAKRAVQTKKKQIRNSQCKSAIRTCEKALRTAIKEKNVDQAKTLFISFSKQFDKATSKGRFHVNTASRKIGRLAKSLHAMTVSK